MIEQELNVILSINIVCDPNICCLGYMKIIGDKQCHISQEVGVLTYILYS